jgi:TP901 family phage tail tape measure protein
MSNLDVALRLRLINQLGGPAKDAKRELEGVGAAAKKLGGAKVDNLAKDLAKTKAEAKGADVALQKVAAGAKKIEGAERLASGLRNATADSERLARSLKRVREEARGANVGGGGHIPPAHRSGARAPGGEGGGGVPSAIVAGSGRMIGAVGGVYAGVRVAGAVKQSFQDFAELDRRMTRLGITADATKRQVNAATVDIRSLARTYAVPVEEALKGLEALVAQGKDLPEALSMMDGIIKSAQASGASIEDMSNSAGAMMTNLKLKVEELPGAFDRLAYAGKKGQFELRDMARYLPELGAAWGNVGQKGADKLADLAAATQIIRKEAGTSERTFNGIRDLLAKINTKEVQGNFKKMGVDLEDGLKKGAKAGKPLFDVLVELTEKAIKGDMAKLPQLFGEIDSRTAISALINLKKEFRELREEIQTKAAGTIVNDIVRVTGDAQASIDRLANSWSAAGIAVGKFVDEATPAVGILERISRGIDGAREYLSGEKKDGKKDGPRDDQPAGPKSSYPGRFQSAAHTKATRDALAGKVAPKSSFPGRFQSAAQAAAQAQHDRELRATLPLRGPMTPQTNYSPVTPEAIAAVRRSMAGITRAIASEGPKAEAEAKAIADRIKAMFNFTAQPRVSPRFDGPATAVPPGAKQQALPDKRAGRSVHIVNHITVQGGGNGRQIGQDIARQLAQLGNNSGALFDTV